MDHKNLPNWDDLTNIYNKDQKISSKVDKLKSYCPKIRFNLSRTFLMFIMNHNLTDRFLNLSWGEIIELMADQFVRNEQASYLRKNKASLESLNPHKNTGGNLQKLPCSKLTAKDRAHRISETASGLDAGILILGDHDLVSLELLELGHTKVTTIDIDKKVLLTIDNQFPFRSKQLMNWDFKNEPPPFLDDQKFELVLMNPPNKIESIKIFIDFALQVTKHSSETKYFLNLHLLSLAKHGLPELSNLLRFYQLDVEEFKQGCNIYPVPTFFKKTILILNKFLISSNSMISNENHFQYFLSDSLILQKSR